MLEANPELGSREESEKGDADDPACPLLGAHQGGDRTRLRRPRHALLPARQRRRRAPGHRPALGRDPDPRRLAQHPPLRLQLPLGRARPEPDPGPDRRARDGAPRPRRRNPSGNCSPSFQHPDGSFEAHHTVDKFWEKAEADSALAGTSGPGTVKSVTARKNTRKPPTPYNTTAFSTDASSRLGITPASAMRIAEDLYMDGFISYPRTDNTVYPSSLPVQELVSSLVRVKEFSAAAGLLDGAADADPRQKRDHRPPADLPDPGDPPGRPRRGPEKTRLRTGRAPLPRHLQPADDHRVDPRRHRGRLGDLLRARLGRRRPRLRRHLHLRPLRRRRDPRPQGGPDPGARGRPLGRRQGDPAAGPDLAGETDRADGGAQPRHQSDPRRHHPEALRPRLRLLEPADPHRDRDRALRGVQEVRAEHGDAGDDRHSSRRRWTGSPPAR